MSQPDVIVIGAGIFGLSVAWSLRRAGAGVRVLEAMAPGAGASGGIVGALTPHAPARWRPMMAFQFRALLDLADRIDEVEAATGLSTGYRRCGRLTPLTSARMRAQAEADAAAAPGTWGGRAEYRIVDDPSALAEGWLAPDAASFGLVHDTVSARIDPRAYVAALAAALGDDIVAGVEVQRVWSDRRVETSAGTLTAGHVVIANGWQAAGLLEPLAPALAGSPVKGQAAVLRADAREMPLIYRDGLYVIPHDKGTVAVGSTSEKRFDAPGETDGQLDALVESARTLCPPLAAAPVIERWAGLRPKPPGREPVIGPLPDSPAIWLATGGYKISFGIAHAVGDAVADGITGQQTANPLPGTFSPEHRLATTLS